MRVHPSFRNIGMSKIVEVSENARLRAPEFESRTGQPFIYFQRGEVGYPVAPFIADGLQEAIQKGWTKYPKSGGESFYKQAVIQDLAHRGVENIQPENVLATCGGQEGLQLVFSYFRGKTCAGFTPCWGCMFDNIFPYTETNFIPVPLRAADGWSIDFELVEKALPSADTFYFNNPHNPTGRVFPRADVERLCGLCAKYGVLLVCDEAYRDLVFTGEYSTPIADERFQNIVAVTTFSKAFAATGFRIGYTVCRRAELIDYLTRGEYTQTAGVPTPIQYAFAKAMGSPACAAWTKDYKAEMRARARAMADHLDPRLKAHAPEGAFYCFINLAPDGTPEQDLLSHEKGMVERLMNSGIAVVPGSAFGRSCAGYARLSFSTLPVNLIEQGVARFNKVVLGEL